MTPKEFQRAIRKLQREIGSDCYISVFVANDTWDNKRQALLCSIYPTGLSRDCELEVEADDFEEILRVAGEKWAAHQVEYRKQTVRKMALAIIRITAEQGHCTDAALRQEFDKLQVESCGADACADANAIAGKGPFAIVTLGGANGAPDHVEDARVQ